MSESPLDHSSDFVAQKISVNGSPIDESIELVSISITNTINKIPCARIELLDGDMPQQEFPLSDSKKFDPGAEIKIEAGYGQKLETLFTGIVIKHSIKITGNNDSRLVIECRDKAVAMTVGRKNAIFSKVKDSEVINQLMNNYPLQKSVTATSIEYEELVQYYCSDWDFLLSRAEVNGLIVIIENAQVKVSKPDTSAASVLKVTYGNDLLELNADIDARSQLAKVESASWDPAQQKLVSNSAIPGALNSQGDLDSSSLARVLNLDAYQLQTAGLLDEAGLKSWAEAQQQKSGLSRIRGRMKFQGSAKARSGTLIELNGVATHFNGNVFVSSVNHQIAEGNWITEASFGMAADWFAEQRDLMAPPAAGLLPGIDGLQIGVVTQLDQDPTGESRIKLTMPLLQADENPVWARLANIYASDGFGAFFIPEIGDEVVVGYLNNDPNNPVVLGSLYSSKRKPPDELSADNYIKAMVTKSKLKLEFDDDRKVITLITPAGNQIIISDDGKSILLQDQQSNKVELNADGITLDSPKDISITAGGKINISATGALSASSNSDLSIKGMNVNCEAQTGFTAKGNASAELSASGQTTVKGGMVMIN